MDLVTYFFKIKRMKLYVIKKRSYVLEKAGKTREWDT